MAIYEPDSQPRRRKIQRRGNVSLSTWQAFICLCLLTTTSWGCSRPKGVIFEPLESPIVWPQPPETPRISYVGALATDHDLKPARSFFDGIGETLFGAKAGYGMIAPNAICTDRDQRVFVCDLGAQLVHVFNLETRRYEQWRPDANADLQFQQPVGIVFDSLGRLLVADSAAGTIFVFDQRGTYLGHFGEEWLTRPCGLAFDPLTNRIYVADAARHELVVLAIDGELIQRVGKRGTAPGEFNFPTNVAVSSNGTVYVSDSLNFRVQIFDAELNPLHQIGRKGDMPGYFSLPKGVAVDRHDRVYVVDANFESVQVFDAAGRLLLTFGEEGSGPGQFWLPSSIFIDHNERIWVSDSYNHRVQVFDPVALPEEIE